MNIIIIGGSSGIGRALAIGYHAKGHNVLCTGRRQHLLDELSSLTNGEIQTLKQDINDGSTCIPLLEQAVSKMGTPDLIIHSSGTGELNPDLDFKSEMAVIETNVTGFTRISTWAYRLLKTAGRGHFACITSVGGLRGNRTAPAYNASKAFQINYLEGLQQKAVHDRLNITITDIRPGSVNTDMMKGDGHFWIATPEKAAAQIMKAVSSGKKTCYITRRWRLIGWLLQHLPKKIYLKL